MLMLEIMAALNLIILILLDTSVATFCKILLFVKDLIKPCKVSHVPFYGLFLKNA
jgi:hypothetical protein